MDYGYYAIMYEIINITDVKFYNFISIVSLLST